MKKRKLLFRGVASLLAVCLVLAGISALYNSRLPRESAVAEKLSTAEKARLVEFLQLRQKLGSQTWPGWETADIPIILYNESHAFLIGYADPPDGWFKVPQNEFRGQAWVLVPGDNFTGEPYYRQPLPAGSESPEAFTVMVGDRWAASMATMEWLEIGLANQFRESLPSFLVPIFPYRIVTNLFVRGSEGYISLLAHESFHAYQGQISPERLAAAETVVSLSESNYPWSDPVLQDAWQGELDLLAAALQAEDEAGAAMLARQFLAGRAQRRQEAQLDERLIDYERQREWLEGLARYVELEIWRQVALAETYEPTAALQDDPNFGGYATFNRRWSQEIDQIGRMAGDQGDGRFYYSGMAQAVLLDQLLPGWKSEILKEGVFLENLLEAAVGSAEK